MTDELTLAAESSGGKMFNSGDDKIIVLQLSGTWKEMGQQYGTFMKGGMQTVWDTTVQPMLDNKDITEKEALELFGRRVYDTSSLRMQQFHQGIAEAIGWSVDKVALLNQSAVLGIYQSKIHAFAGCSSMLAWGKATPDGGMTTGRNMDWGEAFLKFPVVLTVFKPTDGSYSFANVNWPGWFFAQTALNDQGVYIDLHDGTSMGGNVVYVERASLMNSVLDMMAECSSAEALSTRFRSRRPDISFIWTVADATPNGFSFEAATADVLRRNAEQDTLAVVNTFLNPDWGLHVRDTVSNSLTRLKNLRARAEDAHGSIDTAKMMAIFDRRLFNEDGTFKENGGVTKPTKQDADLTVYQVVTDPTKLQMWIKVPLKTQWRQIDLESMFKN